MNRQRGNHAGVARFSAPPLEVTSVAAATTRGGEFEHINTYTAITEAVFALKGYAEILSAQAALARGVRRRLELLINEDDFTAEDAKRAVGGAVPPGEILAALGDSDFSVGALAQAQDDLSYWLSVACGIALAKTSKEIRAATS